jgi:HAD superfamily hydrolase (TIGR01509 family)
MRIRAVLFDMDGVLIDAREWHYLALNSALEIFGMKISRDDHETRFNGLSTSTKLEILSIEQGLPRDLHNVINQIKQNNTVRFAAQNCYPNLNHLILLARLKKLELKTAVVTNSIRATTEIMLNQAQVTQYLDLIVTNQDIIKPKPDPEGYVKAANFLGLLPEQCLVIEDGDYGVQAAIAAGCQILRISEPNELDLEKVSQSIPELVQ